MTSNSYLNDSLLNQDVLSPSLYDANLPEKEDHTYMHLEDMDTNNWPLALMEQLDWTVEYGTIPEQAKATIGSFTHGWSLSESSPKSYVIVKCDSHALQTNSFGWGPVSMAPSALDLICYFPSSFVCCLACGSIM